MYRYAISVPDKIMADPVWLDALAQSRLNRIEFSCDANATADAIGEKVSAMAERQKLGQLTVGSVHIPFGSGWEFSSPAQSAHDQVVSRTAAFIEACAPLNCRNFTMHGCLEPVPLEPRERHQHLLAFRRTLEELLPVARQYNVSINVEDLPRSCLGNTIEELAEMLDGFPLENVGVCFDVNHFCNCAERLPEGIRTFAPRIRAMHISDYDGVDETHWYPGLGIIDWPAIMDAVRELPNDTVLIFECFGFLVIPPHQNRTMDPKLRLKSFERNVFELENAAEIKRRIAEQIIQ